MNNPLQPFLDQAGFMILDGALATELERRGANLDDPLWSARLLLENPDLIRQVHQDYFQAGADLATSASYQATFAGFARRGIDTVRAAELLRQSVDLAKQACDDFWANGENRRGRLRPLVAASIGCYGAFLHDGSEYRGDYGLTRTQLVDFHRARMETLIEAGSDLLACETIPCLVEAEALVLLLEEMSFPAWLSFSCGDEQHLCHGETFAGGVALADACSAVVAVGINCTPPHLITGLLDSAAGKTGKPLVVYPNRGEIWDPKGKCWRPGPGMPFHLGQTARQWFNQGARLIGGCCRTTPDDIAEISRALRTSDS